MSEELKMDAERAAFEAFAIGHNHSTKTDVSGYCHPSTAMLWRAWQAARQAPAVGAVPDGWKLVPSEPTLKMREAFSSVDQLRYTVSNRKLFKAKHSWDAMLAAAPQPTDNAKEFQQAECPADGVVVSRDQLKKIHRDLDACQKVIWLGLRGADPAYVNDAQESLAVIDTLLAQQAQGGES